MDNNKKYSFVDKRREDEGSEINDIASDIKKNEEICKSDDLSGYTVPALDFSMLIMSFASSAVIAMGKAPEPHTGKIIKDFQIAKQNIDIISLLKEKSKGNLTDEESKLIDGILFELRMMFVEETKGENS